MATATSAAGSWVLTDPQKCGVAVRCENPPDAMEFIDNGVVKLGADMTRGGSIGFFALSAAGDGDVGKLEKAGPTASNVVNCHDMGREIQLSFYGGPRVYNPPTAAYPNGACDKLFGGVPWPWNPIGAGDVDGNHGQILEFSRLTPSPPEPGLPFSSAVGYHLLTRPLQWACHNVSCDCTFEQNVTLVSP